MKKFVLTISLIISILTLIGCNGKNSIINTSTIPQAFTDTGIDVKSPFSRVYHIIKDKSGFLYYCSDVENNLIPVLDKEGKLIKDINIFD